MQRARAAAMWWHFWAIILSILFLSIAMLWCVVLCATRCFYPQGTRGPKVRALLPGRPAGEKDRYVMNNGELSWRETQPPPREVYHA